jgi:inosine triphosphate pyrophosphatase
VPELQGDPEEISREKVEEAFRQVKEPIIIEDTSLCFNAYGGLPGPYIKWFLEKLTKDGLHKMLDGFDDKTAYAMTIFAYKESAEAKPVLFIGKTDGSIVPARGPGNFGWDPCFEEKESKKTYAEMNKDEKNTCSHRGKATRELIKYFQNKHKEPEVKSAAKNESKSKKGSEKKASNTKRKDKN